MVKVKIIGATGYGGIGLIEILLRHPEVQIASLIATENIGKPVSELYPHLTGYCDLPIQSADTATDPADITFLSTPDRVGMQLAAKELKAGARVIDFSGDFRFNTIDAYADYAARIGLPTEHTAPALLPEAVYGLTELHRDAIHPATKLVGNPGCFAVSCILGLAPAVHNKCIERESIICDCKTGVSGAGKKLNASFHFAARHENMNAYRLSGHQHICEIERELGHLGTGTDLRVTFTAQAIPLCRGIMSCLYGTGTHTLREKDVREQYRQFYADSPFIRVLPSDAVAGTALVRGTNHCNLVVSVDERCNRLRVVAYIDNLMKGQSGSAVQNMNLLCGLPETTGLATTGMYP
ncbi:MAG: N-acetyl-gamma-glutamyl-phosphate reductase [Kiritimatiellia bacterium]